MLPIKVGHHHLGLGSDGHSAVGGGEGRREEEEACPDPNQGPTLLPWLYQERVRVPCPLCIFRAR